MSTTHYRIGNRYLGAFGDGAKPLDADAVVCPAPGHADDRWIGGQWVPSVLGLINQYRDAVQAHLDAAAQAFGYDDIRTAVTYAEEPSVPKFQAEGQAFRAWRSLFWAYGYEQLALIEAGEREQPTVEQFLAEAPQLDIKGLGQ